MHLSKLFLASILCISLTAAAHEAPVVDIQQQNNSANNTQAAGSTGGSWQPVSSDSNTGSDSNAWQPVGSSQLATTSGSNSQPNNAQQSSTPVQEESSAPVSGSVDQRVSRLEQQMTNYSQMNLPQQISDLQQKNAELQGQLEVAQHSLQTLTTQQKLYYQDTQQQIAQLKLDGGVATPTAKTETSANSNSPAFTKKNNISSAANADENSTPENTENNSVSNSENS